MTIKRGRDGKYRLGKRVVVKLLKNDSVWIYKTTGQLVVWADIKNSRDSRKK